MDEESLEDLPKEKINISGVTVEVDEQWACFYDPDDPNFSGGYGGMDLAIYLFSGMSIWPCGRTYQEGGRDGFEHSIGPDWCECEVCSKIRSLIDGEDEA